MCEKCDGFSETIRIEHPYEYFNIVEQARTILDEGTMVIVEGNCNFDEISRNKFPDDVLYHVFQCTSCGRKFSLCVETYHGSGGSWKVINSANESELFNDEQFEENWNNFLSNCKEIYDSLSSSLKSTLDDIDMPIDIKIVTIVQFADYSREWIRKSIPALNYKKPIEFINTDKELVTLKSVLMSVPDSN